MKYNRVNEMQVLKTYKKIINDCYSIGYWRDYVSIDLMAYVLKTSTYQIKKAYKSLKEKRIFRNKKSTNCFCRI